MASAALTVATGAGDGREKTVVPSPNWPLKFQPQASTIPANGGEVILSARVCKASPLTAMAVTPVRLITCTGDGRKLVGFPSPSWPRSSAPHAQTVPSLLSARLYSAPPATAVTPLKLCTCTGDGRKLVGFPSPSWPSPFPPQAQTVPSLFSARLCSPPAATAITPFRFCTCTGVSRSLMVPSPSWPLPFQPQAQTVRSVVIPK